MVGAAVLGDDGTNGGIEPAARIDPWGGFEIAGLEDLVRLVVAVPGID
jgi:hypothetical protein